MSVPTTINELSTTPGSNSPSGGESPVDGDNHIRALAAFIKMLCSQGSDIASASTITPPQEGSVFDVTGTTTITTIASTNSWDGRIIVLQFDGALQLTHSSNLALPGSANISTSAGDMAIFAQRGSGAWQCIAFHRKDGVINLTRSVQPLTVTRTTSGRVANLTGTNTSENTNHYFGVDSSDNPNVGYYALNWNTGAAEWHFRMGGETSSETKVSVSHIGQVRIYAPSSGVGLRVDAGAYTVVNSVSYNSSLTVDASLSNIHEIGTLTGNVSSFTISNPTAGQTITVRFKQDGTGSKTVATPSGAKIAGSISATANAVSLLTLTYSAADTRWEGAWTQLPA